MCNQNIRDKFAKETKSHDDNQITRPDSAECNFKFIDLIKAVLIFNIKLQ